MTQVVRGELLRMLGMFAETDPRSIEYTQLMRNFEILSNQTDMYDEVVELLSEEEAKLAEVVEFPAAIPLTDTGTDAGAGERDTGAHIVGNSPPSESNQTKDREIEPQETPVSEEAAPSKAVVSQPGIILPPPETDVSQPDVNPPPETGAHPEYKMEDVRAALVAARRKKGVNVTELLREFGVENFSAFPAGRYWELMQRLEGDD